MVVVMAPDATDEDIATVVARVEAVGGEAFVSKGLVRTIIGLVGDIDSFHHLNLRTLQGRRGRAPDLRPLQAGQPPAPSRPLDGLGRVRPTQVPIGPDTFTLLAGPCAVESRRADPRGRADGPGRRRHAAARRRVHAAHVAVRLPGAGRGGLEILADVGAATGLPVVTEVVDARDVAVVAEHADMLQIGTRNMANVGLLQAVGGAGKPVLLKRGMTATIEEWLMAAEYIAQRGNLDIVLCERGIRTFETAYRNTLDISAVPAVQATSHLPVIVDPSHAAGRKDLVVPLARAAIAVGADGVLVDVHPHPELALCDGPQALDGSDLRELAHRRTTAPAGGRPGRRARPLDPDLLTCDSGPPRLRSAAEVRR